MARQAREGNEAAGVSHSEPMDENSSAADPRPESPSLDALRNSPQVEGVQEYPDQDPEPLRPPKLARTGPDVTAEAEVRASCGGLARTVPDVTVDAEVRNEFVDILGTLNGDSEASNVGETLPEQQHPDPTRQNGSHGLPRETRNQERQERNAAPEISNNGISTDQEVDDGKVPIKILRDGDGNLFFRGFKPGMTMVQKTDGKQVVYSSAAALDPDAAAKLPIPPNTLVTPLRTRVAAGSSSSAPMEEEIGSLIASQSAQNRNSVRNEAPDDSDPDDTSFRA